MTIDTSALIAIFRDEPDAEWFADAIEAAVSCHMSAVSFVEASVVLDGSRDPVVSRKFDEFVKDAGIVIEPVTIHQAKIAREAYRDFGKGSGHPARLNFGDCFSYALAKERGEALLFKGNHFTHTDVRRAISSARAS
jgi:ribonuclease VapC